MKNKLDFKKIIAVAILIAIILTSIFVVSKATSSAQFHAKTINSLEEKKMTVMKLTTATTLASVAISAVPGDFTTPIANQMMQLSTYLLLIVSVIFLEKILLTLTGYITFSFLIPIACFLYGIYLFVKNEKLKKLAIKLGIFGIVIFIVIPISVQISSVIENTYQDSINQVIEEATDVKNKTNENSNEESEKSGLWNGLISKAQDVMSNIGGAASDLIKKCEKMLSNFIDAIAILLITSCVIPVAVLIFIIWFIKIIFGINIPVSKIKESKLSNNTQKQQLEKETEISTPK